MDIQPIRTKADYEAAVAEIDRLMGAQEGTPEEARLSVLATLVEAYEEKEFAIEAPDAIEAVKFRMEQAGYEQRDFAALLGSASRASEILNRRRPLTIEMIRTIHKEWKIPLESLLSPYQVVRLRA
jgi:HTH-type transcriptional regulator/antitoxin HigA